MRHGLSAFNCVHCAGALGQQFAMFHDWTIRSLRRVSCVPRMVLVIGLWQLKLNAKNSAAADIRSGQRQRCSNLLDGASTRRTI